MSYSKNKIEVELDLSNYGTKSDLKNAAGIDTLDFAKKGWFSELKIRYWWIRYWWVKTLTKWFKQF